MLLTGLLLLWHHSGCIYVKPLALCDGHFLPNCRPFCDHDLEVNTILNMHKEGQFKRVNRVERSLLKSGPSADRGEGGGYSHSQLPLVLEPFWPKHNTFFLKLARSCLKIYRKKTRPKAHLLYIEMHYNGNII